MPFDVTTNPTEGIATTAAAPLTVRAINTLRAYFEERDHHPSVAHWEALTDIARTIEAMADGTSLSEVFVSSCDCGLGKSQTTIHAVRALVADPVHANVGVIICVGRIAEAETLANDLALPAGRLAVFTSNAETNRSGTTGQHATDIRERTDIDGAQVLIVTQQRIELTCGDGSFAGADSLYFQGKSRQVRIWDEAWLPGTAVSLNQDDLAFLLRPLKARLPTLKAAVDKLYDDVKAAPDDSTMAIPDWEEACGVGLHASLSAVARYGDDAQSVVTGLYILGGRTARVKRDGIQGGSTITFKDTLPEDLAPLLVLDASARIRRTYKDIEAHRGGVVWLTKAVKDYSPLTVHVWHRGGGKNAWAAHHATLIEGITATILTKPDQQWLVVHHQAVNVPRDVIQRLPADVAAKVKFTHWGAHQASNAWRDVPNVILAGTLFMRDSQYAALTYLAHGKAVETYEMPKDAIERTRLGEHKHAILQAVCRGRVRQSDGDKCRPMDAYIIADVRTGIPAELRDVFPHCVIKRWEPVPVPMPPKVKEALKFIDEAMAAGIMTLKEKTIRDLIGVSATHWKRDVTNKVEWKDALAARGLSSEKTGREYVLTGPTVIPGADPVHDLSAEDWSKAMAEQPA